MDFIILLQLRFIEETFNFNMHYYGEKYIIFLNFMIESHTQFLMRFYIKKFQLVIKNYIKMKSEIF